MRHKTLQAAKSIRDAARESPELARLTTLLTQSNSMLASVQHIIPIGLRSTIQAGPVDGETWCLLVSNTAVANKIRHLAPDIERHIRQTRLAELKLRIKVMSS
jgi:hypothetical protein